MKKVLFENFLRSEKSITSEKGIQSRISKGFKVEKLVGRSLDSIVSNDKDTYLVLVKLSKDDHHGNLQNVVRKYYKFINEKEFPTLATYEKLFL